VRRCKTCSETKELSEYHKDKYAPLGHSLKCKQCKCIEKNKRDRTKEGLATKMFGHHLRNSRKRNHAMPTYTNKELLEWLMSQKKFHLLYDNWKRLDYQKEHAPSVDRKNDYIGYTMDNIQLMTWKENNQKKYEDTKAGRNTKTCRAVKQYSTEGKFIAEYYSMSEASRQTGTHSIEDSCKDCNIIRGGFVWRYADEV